ncbi:MAG: ABC transporter permease [Alphaproteobacteria bacterium]
MDVLVQIIVTTIAASTPLIFAATGELVVERSGVLNLGVEGMMLIGAVCAFVVTMETGSGYAGILAGLVGGVTISLIFAVLTLVTLANQVATGLALTIFGIGCSALIGVSHVGRAYSGLPKLSIPGLSDLPVLGPILFRHDILIYLGVAMVAAVWWFLYRTKAGLILRAVGESHDAAHAIGYPVVAIRFAAIAFGGAMCGLAGAHLSLSYTPLWQEGMSAGRGWIALALVVFATWRPWRVLLGAYLFGAMRMLELHGQSALSLNIPSQVFTMLPYLATIIVLVIISRDVMKVRTSAPACLGQAFHPRG